MFAKVFASLWDGTLYGKKFEQLVFVYLLAHADAKGFVDIHPRRIGADCGLAEDIVWAALGTLEGQDAESRSPESGGARLNRIDGHRKWGWVIVNYLKYRSTRDLIERRHQTREATAKWRAKGSRRATVSHGEPRRAQAEVEVEVEVEVEAKETNTLVQRDVERASDSSSNGNDQVSVEEWFTETFWTAYPKKMGRAKALAAMQRAFKGLNAKGEDDLASEIMEGLRRYVAQVDGTDARYVKLAEGWINGRRWEDET